MNPNTSMIQSTRSSIRHGTLALAVTAALAIAPAARAANDVIAINFNGSSYPLSAASAFGVALADWTQTATTSGLTVSGVTVGISGVSSNYYITNTPPATGDDQVYRGYLDSSGATITLSGLSAWLTTAGASSYKVTVVMAVNDGSADGLVAPSLKNSAGVTQETFTVLAYKPAWGGTTSQVGNGTSANTYSDDTIKIVGNGTATNKRGPIAGIIVRAVPSPAPPTVALSQSGSMIAEAAGTATVTATLSAATDKEVTVNLLFSGTATLTTDYTRDGTSIVIPAGATTCTVPVTLTAVQDTVYDPNETIVATIDYAVNADKSGTPQTFTITDDDPVPTAIAVNFYGGTNSLSAASAFGVNKADWTQTNANSGSFLASGVTVSLSGLGSNQAIAGTPVTGDDQIYKGYTADNFQTSSSITLSGLSAWLSAAGASTYKVMVVMAVADSSADGLTAPSLKNSSNTTLETFSISAYKPTWGTNSGSQVGNGTSAAYSLDTIKIVGNNTATGKRSSIAAVIVKAVPSSAPPTVTLSQSSPTIAEAAGTATVTATLSAPTDKEVTVNLWFSSTATLTTDYTRDGTSIVIPAGATTCTVPVTLTAVQDTVYDPGETIVVDIDYAVNADKSGTPQTFTITDDEPVPTVIAVNFHGGTYPLTATSAFGVNKADWTQTDVFSGGFLASGVTVGMSGVSSNYYITNTPPATGDDQIYRGYLDSSNSTITLSGLSAWLTATGATQYKVTVVMACNDNSANGFTTPSLKDSSNTLLETFVVPGSQPAWGGGGSQVGSGTTVAAYANDIIKIVGNGSASQMRGTIAGIIVQVASAATGYTGWATDHANGQDPGLDANHDGVANGVAYFMGMDGLATNPGVVDGKVTWPYVNDVASYEVQVSDNLTDWMPAASGDIDTTSNPGFVIYTLPNGAEKQFCRLVVTP
ncbi:MAG: hypothetical protein NTW21_21075 [Verrucomicrobia bacterium]|nr:hypothetical protein [Verrucomicrobiota bacterium]